MCECSVYELVIYVHKCMEMKYTIVYLNLLLLLNQLLSSVMVFIPIPQGSKYLQHPTERGFKIAQVTANPNIFFAKAFWSLTEREAIKVWIINNCCSYHLVVLHV